MRATNTLQVHMLNSSGAVLGTLATYSNVNKGPTTCCPAGAGKGLAETLTTDDQLLVTRWRRAVGALRDLAVGAADTDQ
jgi:hypothetical protein